MADAPVLTPQVDLAPVPRVEIEFPTVPVGTDTATVYRLTTERTYRVRAGIDIAAAGGFALIDFEFPFQFESQIRAEFFDASGVSLGFSDPTAETLEFDGTLLHNPLDPTRNALVTVRAGTAMGKLSRPMRGGIVDIPGREVSPFIGRGRQALQNVPLVFETNTGQQESDVESIFGNYGDPAQVPVVCVRTSLDLGLPRPFFAAISDPSKQLLDRFKGGRAITWEWSVNEAAPPAEALVTPLLTYADFEAVYTDYADFEAAYATYLDAESDFSIAGSA